MRLAGRQACDEGVDRTATETQGSGGWSDRWEAFRCVTGKSESFTFFSGDRSLLYDTIFDFRQLCLNRWGSKPH